MKIGHFIYYPDPDQSVTNIFELDLSKLCEFCINFSFTNIFGHSCQICLYKYIRTFVGECVRV